MKPKTYKSLCEQFFENELNMFPDDVEQDVYDEMTIENEMIQRFMILEGRKKSFSIWAERCHVEVQARDEGI